MSIEAMKLALEWIEAQPEPRMIGAIRSINALHKAIYTTPPQRQPLTWQPIETAPKDGTAVLIMRDIWPGTNTGRADECNGYNTYVAEWWADEGPSGNWVCYMDSVLDPICPIHPTHWMPLPAPPIEAAHGIKGEE
jgi:hypothetical protein